MKAYLDASVLVSLLTTDPGTERARLLLGTLSPSVIVSDFAKAEFASALARRTRTGELTEEDARAAFQGFDAWVSSVAEQLETGTADVAAAEGFLRRLDLTLRTPDALNIALAQRAGATLITFDDKMAASARRLGLATAP